MHARQRGQKSELSNFSFKMSSLFVSEIRRAYNEFFIWENPCLTDAFFFKNSILQEYIKIANIFISTK